MRAVFNEPEIRDTVFAGLVDILYGDSPKEAVISLLTFINEKLQGSQSFEKVFDITLEEAELFDVLVGALRFELFDRSQIYKVIMVMSYVADDQLRMSFYLICYKSPAIQTLKKKLMPHTIYPTWYSDHAALHTKIKLTD